MNLIFKFPADLATGNLLLRIEQDAGWAPATLWIFWKRQKYLTAAVNRITLTVVQYVLLFYFEEHEFKLIGIQIQKKNIYFHCLLHFYTVSVQFNRSPILTTISFKNNIIPVVQRHIPYIEFVAYSNRLISTNHISSCTKDLSWIK